MWKKEVEECSRAEGKPFVCNRPTAGAVLAQPIYTPRCIRSLAWLSAGQQSGIVVGAGRDHNHRRNKIRGLGRSAVLDK